MHDAGYSTCIVCKPSPPSHLASKAHGILRTHTHTHRQLFRQVAHIAKPLKQLSSLESYLFDNNRHGTVGMAVCVFVCK